ncbi:MAG: hypothetical protein Crog4KO_23150 [Crocinitomicaceae bacterium]
MIVIYAVEKLDLTRIDAIGFYGSMTSLTYLSMIFAGVIADLTKGTKWVALAGGLFEIIGVICFISGDLSTVIIGGIFFAVGSGSFVVASLSAFARSQFEQLKTLHSGWTIYYVLINGGAFLGILYAEIYLSDTGPINFDAILYASLPVFALGALFTFINTPNFPKVKRKANTHVGRDIVLIIFSVITTALFWCCYEAFGGNIAFWIAELHRQNPDITPSQILNLNSYTVIAVGILLFVIWSFYKTTSLRLFAVAFGIAIAAFALLYFRSSQHLGMYNSIVLHTIFLAIAEVIIMPITLSIQNTHSNPRFLGIIMGGALLAGTLINKVFYQLDTPDFGKMPIDWGITIIIFVLLAIFIVWFVLQFFLKDRFSFESVGSKNETNIDLKEDEILD